MVQQPLTYWFLIIYDGFLYTRVFKTEPQILKTDKEVHVLNLSQPGNVILNQIVNFTLYGHQLAPDIVIAHQGFNDVVNGPFLILIF